MSFYPLAFKLKLEVKVLRPGTLTQDLLPVCTMDWRLGPMWVRVGANLRGLDPGWVGEDIVEGIWKNVSVCVVCHVLLRPCFLGGVTMVPGSLVRPVTRE